MLKYAVFWLSLAGVPVLAGVLAMRLKWIRWAIFGMVVGLCIYQPTAINFFSHEWYTGTARGMEISLIHLLALAVVLALALRGKRGPLLPEGGIRIYAVYFFLCLPSLLNADDPLIGWLEVWKMILLFLFWHAVYRYLRATGDVGCVVMALALFTLADFVSVLRQHYGGRFQVCGVFPTWNSLGAGMNLLGAVCLAGYLQMGLRNWMGRLFAAAAAGAAASTVWSYSRVAIATMPVAYGMAALGCLVGGRRRGAVLLRLTPVVLAGFAGICIAWAHIVDRFVNAPKQSGETRREMAYCAFEMMNDHPFAGVGINNISLNMTDDHPYRKRAEEKMGKELETGGVVETLYFLVGAECGIPAALALIAWFGWHALASLKATWVLRGTEWHFVAAGLAGGISANILQGTLDWALRQPINLFLLGFCFALTAYLARWKRSAGTTERRVA